MEQGSVDTLPPLEPILLRTVALTKHFSVNRGLAGRRHQSGTTLKAVDEVSLSVRQGETLGVVGETGSGKSTLGRLLLRLETPTSGDAEYEGQSIYDTTRTRSRELRQRIQIILQDPYSTLNPYKSVRATIEEVLGVYGSVSAADRTAETENLLAQVGFPVELMNQRPNQLSGGGRQRVSIARALAVRPRLLVADEPLSALDVSVQAQVLNLFERLRRELGLTYVFISHDLSVVRRLSDRIAVMYLGKVVEEGATTEIFNRPLHPYTKALLDAAPEMYLPRTTRGPALSGDMPNPIAPPAGCVFHPRCPQAMEICRLERPVPIQPIVGRTVACHLHTGPPVEAAEAHPNRAQSDEPSARDEANPRSNPPALS